MNAAPGKTSVTYTRPAALMLSLQYIYATQFRLSRMTFLVLARLLTRLPRTILPVKLRPAFKQKALLPARPNSTIPRTPSAVANATGHTNTSDGSTSGATANRDAPGNTQHSHTKSGPAIAINIKGDNCIFDTNQLQELGSLLSSRDLRKRNVVVNVKGSGCIIGDRVSIIDVLRKKADTALGEEARTLKRKRGEDEEDGKDDEERPVKGQRGSA